MAENSSPGASPPLQTKGPYAPTTASTGGLPTVGLDVAVTAVFLVLFMIGAAVHMYIFQVNKKRGHKFLMSGMTFGFCMARITTCVLRIAWATRPTNLNLAIAAQVFVSAGVVLLFVINLIFAQRITRARHPHFGWHKLLSAAFNLYYASIVVSLVMLIICTVQSFFTLNLNTKRIDRDVQLYGSTYFAVAAFLPIPLVVFGLLVPRTASVDKFGVGRFRSKIYILLAAAALLTLGAAFRTGTAYLRPRPKAHPAWYHSKACFYIFNLTIEIVVVYLYALLRVDMRFHVPDGSHGPGSYAAKGGRTLARVMTEEEVFDDEAPNGADEGKDEEDVKEKDDVAR